MRLRAAIPFLLFASLWVTPAVSGQSAEAKKYAAKESSAFAVKIPWLREVEKAKAAAAAKDRLIFAYFTRSYAP